MIKVYKIWLGSVTVFGYYEETLEQRRSEGLRNLKYSNGTNLMILLILVGDIETNPCPRHRCGFRKKYGKASEK